MHRPTHATLARFGLLAVAALTLVVLAWHSADGPASAQTTDPTVQAAVDALFTQTAEAAGVPATAFAQTVEAAFSAALTATAQAGAGAGPVATQPPARITLPPEVAFAAQDTLALFDGAVTALAYAPDGVRLAVGSAEGRVFVLVPGRDAPLDLAVGAPVSSLAWAPDGSTLAVGSDADVSFWAAADGTAISRASVPGVRAAQVLAYADDGALVARAEGGLVRVALDGTVTPVDADFVAGAGVIVDGAPVLAGRALGDDNPVLLRQGDAITRLPQDRNRAVLALATDGAAVVISDDAGQLAVLGLPDGAVRWALTGEPQLGVAAFSPDGALLAAGGERGDVLVFDAQTGRSLLSLERVLDGGTTALAFAPDGLLLLAAGANGVVQTYALNPARLALAPAPMPTAVPLAAATAAPSAPTPLPPGFPTPTRASILVAEQVFERGRMFWLEPVGQIWVLTLTGEGRGDWQIFPDTFDEATDPEIDPALAPPDGLYAPSRGFGKLWRDNPPLREALGWGLTPEFGYESRYVYVPGGTMANGQYVPGPGYHVVYSLNSEAFRFNEGDGTWQLGE